MIGSSFARRRGFTLVELLVVIAIIGILIAMLLPAVQAAREAARRSQCLNNLKQLAIALHNYHDKQKSFPPSSVWRAGVNPETKNNASLSENWVILILPELEQQPLYKRFDLTQFITAGANQPARSTVLSVMTCPSDGYNRNPFNGSANGGTNQMGDGWARGNYAANAGGGSILNNGMTSGQGWQATSICGVMGANQSLSLAGVTDGSSNTILLGEIRAGICAFDGRGVWAMSGGCPSALWAQCVGDDIGPNCNQLYADDTLACPAIQDSVGGPQALAKMGMPCSRDDWPNFQQTTRSQHPGGVLVALCDGSVRFLSDYIDISSNWGATPPVFSTWDRLNLSRDGSPVDAGKL